uniref:Rhodanese domain-containing protein n=1 Tax=Haemonchus contortus TaxID=6289 RepID=A0A7I4YS44_HAECO
KYGFDSPPQPTDDIRYAPYLTSSLPSTQRSRILFFCRRGTVVHLETVVDLLRCSTVYTRFGNEQNHFRQHSYDLRSVIAYYLVFTIDSKNDVRNLLLSNRVY